MLEIDTEASVTTTNTTSTNNGGARPTGRAGAGLVSCIALLLAGVMML
jgi:hypothetical protein